MVAIISVMVRWQPDAVGRLQQAALELYSERGFDSTTVAEIAKRAGLTERTFFRYFADKREVLFNGSADLQTMMVASVESAPQASSPMQVMTAALASAGEDAFEHRRDYCRLRQGVINANAELQERELIKLATLGSALAAALRARGVAEPAASLAAESGMAVFRIAFERWTADPASPSLSSLIHDSVGALQAVVTGSAQIQP